jgi:hypothetical protein
MFVWGSKSKRWVIDNKRILVLTWKYMAIAFFPFTTYEEVWKIEGENRSEDKIISHDEVMRLFPTNTPDIGLWDRYGLWLFFGGCIVLTLLMNLAGK